jgi:hypothetical protein
VEGLSSVADLIAGIRAGMVPRSIRLFAAQGLLPVSREDLIRVLALLAAEGDEEVAATAATTLSTFSPDQFRAVLSAQGLDSLDLDLLARAAKDEAVQEVIVRHPLVATETLRWLARNGSARVQDAVVTNQARLMDCLEILEDLRANPQASQDVLRRVREFEEEFLEKAVVWATAGTAPEIARGPSIEDALSALKAIGMLLPGAASVERLSEPEPGAPREVRDAFLRLALMNTHERILRALKGSREERLILVRDRSTLVVRAVMASPKLSEGDVEQIAGLRSANELALRIIASKGRWLRRYLVARNLAFNPRTPPAVAMQIVGRLTLRDLTLLARDRNVGEGVRRLARQRMEEKR